MSESDSFIRRLARRLTRPLRRFWGESTDVAEVLSDAGHGPPRWTEDSGESNPFAGAGPRRDDDRPLPDDRSRP